MIFLISLKDCFDKGLIKKAEKSTNLAKKSLRQAEFFLEEASDLVDTKKQISLLTLYNSFFHTARALLYNDGFKERSHFCIARYLESEYINNNKIDSKFLHAFETVMSLRHTVQYSTDKVEIEEDIVELINLCEEFIVVVSKLIT